MLRTLKQKAGLEYYKLQRRLALITEEWKFLLQVKKAVTLKILIGSSGVFENGWIPTNYQYLNLLIESDWQKVFDKKKIDVILAEHVFEHLTEAEGRRALQICHKHMKQGARLRVAVPDGFSPDRGYIDMVKPGGTGEGSDDHKALYNVELLEEMLVSAGFAVERLEYYDSNGLFHHFPWDPLDGMIHRSLTFDDRNADGVIRYTPLILDGFKL